MSTPEGTRHPKIQGKSIQCRRDRVSKTISHLTVLSLSQITSKSVIDSAEFSSSVKEEVDDDYCLNSLKSRDN